MLAFKHTQINELHTTKPHCDGCPHELIVEWQHCNPDYQDGP